MTAQRTRLLVCGSRVWTDPRPIKHVITAMSHNLACVIEGEAHGADRIAREVAESHDIEVVPFPAQWEVHAPGWCHCQPKGRTCPAAGPRRNQQMLDEGQPTDVAAFSDDFWNPRSGTHHMCSIALKAGLRVMLVEHVAGPSRAILEEMFVGQWRSRFLTPDDLVAPAPRQRRRP